MGFRFEDIVNYPHPVSKKHGQLSMRQRAAQFSPFSPLSGHAELLDETARWVDSRPELASELLEETGRRLALLLTHPAEAGFTFFEPDPKKEGGICRTVYSIPARVDEIAGLLLLQDGTEIPLAELLTIKSPLFEDK